MRKTLPSIRISENTAANIKAAIAKYNDKNLVAVTEQEFRRIAYEVLSQIILQQKEIPVKIR